MPRSRAGNHCEKLRTAFGNAPASPAPNRNRMANSDPLPWAALDYQPENNAYVVPYSKEQLKQAPSDSLEALIAGKSLLKPEAKAGKAN